MTTYELCEKWEKEAAALMARGSYEEGYVAMGMDRCAAELRACANELRALDDGWIEIAKQKPPEGVRVLFYSPETDKCHAWIKVDKIEFITIGDNTHWQPLPQPPKETK